MRTSGDFISKLIVKVSVIAVVGDAVVGALLLHVNIVRLATSLLVHTPRFFLNGKVFIRDDFFSELVLLCKECISTETHLYQIRS